MNTPTPHETPEHRIDRQAAYFRNLAELNMDCARIAGINLKQAHAAGEDTHKPTLDLGCATRGVIGSVNAENALFRKQAPPRAPAGDSRRPALADALHKAANAEPNPVARAALHREIGPVIEETLLADPDAETPLHTHVFAVARRLGIHLDVTTLPDALLGIAPRTYPQPGSRSADTADPWPNGRAA